MPIIRAQVSLESTSGIPADVATNTYHFDAASGGTGPVATNMLDLLEDLYVGVEGTPGLISTMSTLAASGDGQIRLYNLDDPEPRAPYASRDISGTPSSTDTLPTEVALCVSFRGPSASGEPAARRRGRIYVPWPRIGANDGGRPSEDYIDDVEAAFVLFATAADASISVDWVIWSPTADEAYGIVGGFIDNAWDTQRRRGRSATGRRLWP